MSNYADLLKDLGSTNSSQAAVFGDAIGTIADFTGVIGAAISIASFVGGLFETSSDPNEQVLQEIGDVYQQLSAQSRAQDIMNRLNFISSAVAPALSVASSLSGLIAASPPLTQSEIFLQLETCLTAMDTLQNASWSVPANDPLYWGDEGDLISDTDYALRDTGYGSIVPQPDDDDLVFYYTYMLPSYLATVAIFVGAATAFGPSYLAYYAGTPAAPGPLRIAARVLSQLHDTIQSGILTVAPRCSGSQILAPGQIIAWTIQNLWDLFYSFERGGWITNEPLAGTDWHNKFKAWTEQLVPPTFFEFQFVNYFPGIRFVQNDTGNATHVATIEYGAVELYSGFGEIGLYQFVFDPLTFPLDRSQRPFQKFQVRVMRKEKQVYIGVGLQSVRDSINSLNFLVGDPALTGPSPALWSFREIADSIGLASDRNGKISLKPISLLLKYTLPIDTEQDSFVTSFQELLTH